MSGSTALRESELQRDQDSANRLQQFLLNETLTNLIAMQTQSQCVEVCDMAYLLLGNYLKNGLDISQLWLDVN